MSVVVAGVFWVVDNEVNPTMVRLLAISCRLIWMNSTDLSDIMSNCCIKLYRNFYIAHILMSTFVAVSVLENQDHINMRGSHVTREYFGHNLGY